MGDRRTAIDFYNQGVTSLHDLQNPTRLTHAYQLFASACIADPTYGMALYQYGNNNSDLKQPHAAIAAWRRALECENTPEEHSKILANLGWQLLETGRVDEALKYTQDAIAMNPILPLAHLNLSLIYKIDDQPEASVAAAGQAFALDPNDIQTEIALAFALLFNGNYEEGFRRFEKRFEWRLKNFLQFPYPRWQGEPGKTLYLVSDQGLGDTLSFARFVEDAAKRCKYIHAQVQPELMRLFSYAFSYLPNLNLIPTGSPFPEADMWSTFVSLPAAMELTDYEIRTAEHIKPARFPFPPATWKVPDRKLHIGISWAGSPLGDIDKYRNIPLHHFLELYRVPGIQLYSLQASERGKESNEQGCFALIRDLTPYIRDVADTLTLLNDLDLVITAESALGHIAALAGKECWIPYSYQGRDYRLGCAGEKLLWTPNTRVFRQDKSLSWENPFGEMIAELRTRV